MIEVTSFYRLKALEFLALLLADASHIEEEYAEGVDKPALPFDEEIGAALGPVALGQLQQAVRHGALVEGRVEALVQSILHSSIE